MYNKRARPTKARPFPEDLYDCSTYKMAYQKRLKQCSCHHISTKALRTIILETIKATSAYAISNEDEFIQKVREASLVQQAQAAKDLKRKLNRDQKRCDDLDGIIKKLYESYAVGRITEERFDALLPDYEQEQAALRIAVTEAEKALTAFEQDTTNVEHFLALAKKYTDFSELTTPMINEFIDKIVVHASTKVDGERMQEVEVYLQYIGRFEAPLPELTPEEIAEQERLRKRRIRDRENRKRRANGQMWEPHELVCQGCGKVFMPKGATAKYCCPNCKQRTYRQKKKIADSETK